VSALLKGKATGRLSTVRNETSVSVEINRREIKVAEEKGERNRPRNVDQMIQDRKGRDKATQTDRQRVLQSTGKKRFSCRAEKPTRWDLKTSLRGKLEGTKIVNTCTSEKNKKKKVAQTMGGKENTVLSEKTQTAEQSG